MKDNDIFESPIRRKLNALITIFLVLAVLLCLYVVIQVLSRGYVNVFGFSMFRVVTGSMEPTIPVGALLITRETTMEQVNIGDIICFYAQESAIFGKMMTHRVIDIHTAIDGSLFFETKGDANLSVDGYFVTAANYVGKVTWYTGETNMLTSVFNFFTNKIGFLACIMIPCLVLSGLILKDCVKNIQNEIRNAARTLEEEEKEEDYLLEMSPEEYEEMYKEMYRRIRAELIEELKLSAQSSKNP